MNLIALIVSLLGLAISLYLSRKTAVLRKALIFISLGFGLAITLHAFVEWLEHAGLIRESLLFSIIPALMSLGAVFIAYGEFILLKHFAEPINRMMSSLYERETNGALKDYFGRLDAHSEIVRLYFTIEEYKMAQLASRSVLEQHAAELEEEIRRKMQRQFLLEKKLVQVQKLESLGLLAAGVAHEINNPLGYVASNLDTLAAYTDAVKGVLEQHDAFLRAISEKAADAQLVQSVAALRELEEERKLSYILGDIDALLKESVEGAARISDIVQRLKVFAQTDEVIPEDFNANDSIETAVKLVWNELKYKCRVRKELSALPVIRGYPGQICQVFMNLLMNAAQAIAESGDIVIESAVVEGGIRVRVSDSGKGMNPEDLALLFSPFFTTQPVGKGTGLGLSVSYGIIKKHAGDISVESEVGRGTTVTVFLPLTVADRPAAEFLGDKASGRPVTVH